MMAAAIAATWAGGVFFLLFWAIAAAGVAWEWQRLVGGERQGVRLAVTYVTMLAATPWALYADAPLAVVILIAGAAATAALAEADRRTWAAAGVLYAGAVLVAPALLRASPTQGLAAVLWLYAAVWGTDIGAYFGGRLIGGAKLWPAVSPGKTWSGALVGAATGAILGVLAAAAFTPGGVRPAPLFLVGLIASALAQAGDLFESAMKRRAGVKDSSRIIPGHGGLMDRLDGFIVAAAFAAVLAWARSAGPWIAPGLLKW